MTDAQKPVFRMPANLGARLGALIIPLMVADRKAADMTAQIAGGGSPRWQGRMSKNPDIMKVNSGQPKRHGKSFQGAQEMERRRTRGW